MIISISSPYGSGCSGRDSTLFHLVLSLCRCTGISVNKRDFSFQSKSPTLLSPCRVFAYLSVSRNPVTCGLTRIGRAQTKMHKTPEKVLSHIPGPAAGLAREKRIAEGTAGSIQPGYEVTGMQSTISGSPPHESSANRNQEGTATYSSAPVVLRPAYMGGQAMTAGESTRPPVSHALLPEIPRSREALAGIQIRRCRDGVSCVTWSRRCRDATFGTQIPRSSDDSR